MAKKFESPPDTETKTSSDNSAQISLEDLQIEPTEKNPAQIEIEKLRVELAKLGLKIIDDIKIKRVSKPEETYNSLVALYNAVKY